MVDDIFSRPQAASRGDTLPRTTSLTHRRRTLARGAHEGVLRANPSVSRPEDSFVSPNPPQSPSRLSSFTRPHFSSRRQKRRVDVPEPLRDPKTKSVAWDIETYEADDGSVEVVDCAFIASRKDLRRWRLSLTDFHALLTGGTEAIEAYRTEQQRKDQERKAIAQHDHDVQDVLDADEELAQQLLRAEAANALPSVAQTHEAAAQPDSKTALKAADTAPQTAPQEPLWRTVLAFPHRALKRLWACFIRLVGA